MTDSSVPARPRLWTLEGFRDDEWSHADDETAFASPGRFILAVDALRAMDPGKRRSVADRLGVVLQPGERIELILDILPDLALVALAFPVFNDGRSFSKAQLLRSRYGYGGPIRAVGQVLYDQLPHMIRLGFDQFEVVNSVLAERLEAGRLGGIGLYYQPAYHPAATPARKGAAYSWRRVASGREA
jgi:uncharacterized protein (DUF934 family)